MKKILAVLVLGLFVLCLSASIHIDGKLDLHTQYISPIYGEDFDQLDMYDAFDHMFIAKVKSPFLTVNDRAQNNGLPDSYFYIETLLNFKGDLKEREIIKFVGGYDEDGVLILIDDMVYPEVGAYYLFFAKAQDHKTHKGLDGQSLIIYNSKMMTKLDGFVEGYDIQYQSDDIIDLVSSYTTKTSANLIDDGISFEDCPDCGTGSTEPSNGSFSTAEIITLNNTHKANFSNGYPLYYKIHNKDFHAYGFYSFNRTNNVNVFAELYDANGNFLTFNADAAYAFLANNHGLTKTTSPHFYMNYSMRPGRTYFLKLTPSESTPFGSIDFKFEVDNVMLGAYEEFLLPGHSVPSDKKVYYHQKSKYTSEVTEAISMWNDLKPVEFIHQTGGIFSRVNLTIRDYSNSSSGVILGTYNWSTNVISLNTYYLDQSRYSDSRLQVIVHELGHALGIDHTPQGNIMYHSITWQQHIGPTDIAVYRQRWS
jgi:predicted Zn-dependent protease